MSRMLTNDRHLANLFWTWLKQFHEAAARRIRSLASWLLRSHRPVKTQLGLIAVRIPATETGLHLVRTIVGRGTAAAARAGFHLFFRESALVEIAAQERCHKQHRVEGFDAAVRRIEAESTSSNLLDHPGVKELHRHLNVIIVSRRCHISADVVDPL